MKKRYIWSIILTVFIIVVFFIIDVILCEVMSSSDYGRKFDYYFLPAIFMEIAIFGCIIIYFCVQIYLSLKSNEKKADKKEEVKNEQLNIDGDSK